MKRALALVLIILFVSSAGVASAQLSLLSSLLGGNSLSLPRASAAEVDLLFNADSYTPPWYGGRALPSPGTSLHLQAIPHFTLANGARVPDSQIVYTWRVNGQVVGSASGLGASSAVIPSPQLFSSDTISVKAETEDGSYTGSASVTIPAVDPFIVLYEDHPLFGIEYYASLDASTEIADSEMTFAAVPYFVADPSANDASLSYNWSVNGISPTGTSSLSSEITVNTSQSSSWASVNLTLTSADNPLLEAGGTWNVLFDAPSSAFAPSSLQTAPSNNPFHPTGQ